MMIKAILAPLVGGVIGYITNDLAIRMLFRPRKAIYIGRFHVPFTPGLIPAQQKRIAASIGAVVSGQLLNEETLRHTLLSEGTIHSLQEKVRGAVHSLAGEERTLKQLLLIRYDEQTIDSKADQLQAKLTDAVCEKIAKAKIGYTVVDSVVGDKMDIIAQNKLIALLLDDNTQRTIKEKLAEKVDEIIAERAPDAVRNLVGQYREEILDMRVCDIYERFRDREEAVIDYGTDIYVSLLDRNISKLLKAVNIEQIVVDKINALNPAELEAMIFDIMKKELNAIVYLGALLGFIMGFVNLLFLT